MSRRGRSKPSGGTQLFSFLDAMICTMGALVVLLHAFARHGQIQIIKEKEPRAVQREQELQAEKEDLEWRTAHLRQARAKTEAELAEERLKLSHVEDHQRRLQQRFAQLKIAASELERSGSARTQQREQAVAELEATRLKVREAREAVENARRAMQEKVANYTIVPYEGPNHTTRRPVYIECRGDSVVLQPEGIELVPSDFVGVLGAGNPLAAALRSTREYLARQPEGAKSSTEPYPLLLVRPDGIEAYYAARAALDSWASEFGYELIGSDWQLTFPEPDSQLAELTRQVVAEARVRQQEYIATSPQLNKNRPRTTFHASAHGGFVPERGSRGGGGGGTGGSGPGGWDSLGSNWARRTGTGGGGTSPGGDGMDPSASSSTGNGMGPSGSGGSGTGSDQYAGTGIGSGADRIGGTGRGTGTEGDRPGDLGTGQGSASQGGSGRDGLLSDGSQVASGGRYGAANGSAVSDQSGSGYGGGNSGQTGQSASKASGQFGSPSGGDNQSDGSALASASGSAGGTGGSSKGSGPSSGASSSSGSSGGSGSPGGSPGSQSGSVSVGGPTFGASSSPGQKPKSLASTRGQDWGLPDGGAGSAAATRPIMIECYNDRLVILSENKNELAQVTPLGPKAQDSMDEFVSHVWQHMKSWGMAGKGLHWRPTLLVQVAPGAADRYAEVKALLDNSGLDVHERQPRSTANVPAKNTRRK